MKCEANFEYALKQFKNVEWFLLRRIVLLAAVDWSRSRGKLCGSDLSSSGLGAASASRTSAAR